MLKTYEKEPQLIVKVGDLPAVCHNLTCDFSYIQPEGSVTAFTYAEDTKKVTITGVDLPSVIANISSIDFALSSCTVDEATITNTSVECTLTQDPTCGTFKPIYKSVFGIIPNTEEMAGQSIQCTVASATPVNSLNLLGGDNITISGTNLPHNLETSTVTIKFSDT